MTSGHVFIATSLDGFIARPDGAIDWLDMAAGTNEDHGYAGFIAGMDGIVMGRATYETVRGFGDWPYALPVTVLSTTMTTEDVPEELSGRATVAGSVEAAMEAAREAGWKSAYIDGGATIRSFLRAGLIHDMTITRIPVLLGEGLPLFGALGRDIALRHAETRVFASGLVQSRYEVPR